MPQVKDNSDKPKVKKKIRKDPDYFGPINDFISSQFRKMRSLTTEKQQKVNVS
jgi:hypothetical protein